MITTIQLHEETKQELDIVKRDKESYEDLIIRLLEAEDKQKRMDKKLIIKGYKKMAKESLRITKEWEATDKDLDWEW